jgi:hypothetical protein
MPVFIA